MMTAPHKLRSGDRGGKKAAAAPAPSSEGPNAAEELEPKAGEAAHLLKLLSSEQRLTILCRLSGGEMSVGELGKYVPLSQSALSQHLGKLRAERIVTTRRDAQTIYYRLSDPAAEKLIGFLCELYGGH